MAQRTDTISITDEAEILEAGYLAIAKSYGWTETVKDAEGNEIPNPQSARAKSIEVTKRFWREIVVAYQSQQAADAARLATAEATGAALDNTTVTLTTGE